MTTLSVRPRHEEAVGVERVFVRAGHELPVAGGEGASGGRAAGGPGVGASVDAGGVNAVLGGERGDRAEGSKKKSRKLHVVGDGLLKRANVAFYVQR